MSRARGCRWSFLAALGALVALTVLAALPRRAGAAEQVRVLISEGKSGVTVASAGGLTLTDATGRRILLQRAAPSPVRVLAQRQAVLVPEVGATLPVVLAWPGRLPTVSLDGQAYRGRLELRRLNGGLATVNVVEMEDYLQGVLKDEIPPGWPAEAAKAMAVAARTYAAFRMRENPGALFHVRATTASQVYGGATGEDARTSWAVQATAGQILTFAQQPFPAFYHSCSGGTTEDALDVFGLEFDMVVGVADDYSRGCPHALWIARLSAADIERALARAGYPARGLRKIEPLLRSRGGRVLRLAVSHGGGRSMLEGKRFREAIGYDVVRSTDFEVRSDAGGFTFVGRGSGHGVGLSQWGAKEMADLA
ncbi:MAG: SpoIID/LytB domain-containing protein, partial [Acidobacteria bacterium]